MRFAWLRLAGVVTLAIAGCQADRGQQLAAGPGLQTEAGVIEVNPTAVPIVSSACASGQVVIRSSTGWECAWASGPSSPTGPTGPAGPTGPTGPAGTACDTARLEALAAAITLLQTRMAALESTACPRGFSRDASEPQYPVCRRTLNGLTDEMVKVGDFWIDRYEATVCGTGWLGGQPGQDTTAVACSVAGAMPEGNITWFQAAAMCANAGKRLCTNAEWQTAVSGTPDPGPWPDTDPSDGCSDAASRDACNTCAGGPGVAGGAAACVSRFGVYDLIGNHWEWVADWYQAGRSWEGPFGDGQVIAAWPPGYGDGLDMTWNLDGRTFDGTQFVDGLPAAGLRGGAWNNGWIAGAFSIALIGAPSDWYPSLAARCCLSGP